jgi:sulfofructosephosphate aldolase
VTADRLAPLRLPGGGFGLVALDQRQSLRDMLSFPGSSASDDQVADFKIAAITALAPHAPAILLDHRYGLDPAFAPVAALPDTCSLILAADLFDQPPGGPVRSSRLDPVITPEVIANSGARALKLYVIWRRSDTTGERNRTVEDFLRLCRDAEVPGIVEGVVRPDHEDWAESVERDQAIVDAAVEFGSQGPDLYKAEVPDHGQHAGIVRQRSAEVTSALECPWVVLSTGVAPDAFADAVAAACEGGAAGFLAGRAIWSGATAATDRDAALRGESVNRLRALISRVPARTVTPPAASEARGTRPQP